jgi:hypothetical protein
VTPADSAGSDGMRARRVRRPSVTRQAVQLLRVARTFGLDVAVTIEGEKITATPLTERTGGEDNEWDRDLGCNPAQVRQRLR